MPRQAQQPSRVTSGREASGSRLGATPADSRDAQVIAIVDDDPSILRALHRLVQSNGYSVESFASARDFLDAVSRWRPDCLVLDVHLNGSGFELQERLAGQGMTIPIIFITAHDDNSTRRRVEKSGAAAYLWKPVDEQALLHAIRRAIGPDDNPDLGGTKVQ